MAHQGNPLPARRSLLQVAGLARYARQSDNLQERWSGTEANRSSAGPEGEITEETLHGPHKGKVIARGYDPKQKGNWVTIERHDGHQRSHYWYLHTISAKEHEIVDVMDPIGTCGSTGYSTGPHLHLEIEYPYWNGFDDKNPRFQCPDRILQRDEKECPDKVGGE